MSPGLQWFPVKIFNHLGNTTWMAITVVPSGKPCSSPLHCLKLLDMLGVPGVPCWTCMFKCWSDKSLVCCRSRRCSTSPHILPNEAQGLIGFGCHVINVAIPSKIFADGDSKIFAGVNHILAVIVYCVVCGDRIPLVKQLLHTSPGEMPSASPPPKWSDYPDPSVGCLRQP